VQLRRRPRSNRTISPIPAEPTAADPPHARCCSGRMAQTDGRTPYRYVDPAAHTMRRVPVNKLSVCCVVRRRRATVVDSKASSPPVMTSSSSSRCGTRHHSPSVMTMTLMLVLMQVSTTSSTGAHLHTPAAAAHCTVVGLRRHFLLGVCPSVVS